MIQVTSPWRLVFSGCRRDRRPRLPPALPVVWIAGTAGWTLEGWLRTRASPSPTAFPAGAVAEGAVGLLKGAEFAPVDEHWPPTGTVGLLKAQFGLLKAGTRRVI
jgi:hypothetical protein